MNNNNNVCVPTAIFIYDITNCFSCSMLANELIIVSNLIIRKFNFHDFVEFSGYVLVMSCLNLKLSKLQHRTPQERRLFLSDLHDTIL